MGELWGVHCEDLGENSARHNGIALQVTSYFMGYELAKADKNMTWIMTLDLLHWSVSLQITYHSFRPRVKEHLLHNMRLAADPLNFSKIT